MSKMYYPYKILLVYFSATLAYLNGSSKIKIKKISKLYATEQITDTRKYSIQ